MINELVEEIKDLLEIPEIERIIHHRIKEIKNILSRNIHLYRDIEESLLEVKPPKNPGKMHLCGQLFELSLIGKKTWIPSIPNQPNDCDIYAIIPREIIDFIVKYEAQTGLAILLPGHRFPGLKERQFDLTFEKINNKRFTGIIYEHEGDKKEVKVKIETPESKVDDGEKYKQIKQLNHYMLRNDVLYRHFMTEFLMRWKPVIDNKNMDITEG